MEIFLWAILGHSFTIHGGGGYLVVGLLFGTGTLGRRAEMEDCYEKSRACFLRV